MNKISIVLITSLVLGVLGIQKVNAQLTTDPTVAPADAVELLLGQGVTIQNLEFSGQASQVGSFDCAGCGLGIATGLVMATGSVDVAEGPNNEGGAEGGFGTDGVSDPDLDVIATEGLNNAVVLEFDFIATGDSVEFEYIFASEEYPEFVNAGFNDVFGFFLSGPGIAGGQGFEDDAENIALIPGTTTPVSIDNVNDGLNQEFYVSNNGGEFPDVQFDGFTTNLIAQKGNLLCDSTYHIKLAIADAGDGSWDSGVFLAANSFTSNQVFIEGSASIDSPLFLGDSVIVEGCNEASFSLVRPNAEEEATITIEILGTAENGVDIVPALDTVFTFMAGESSISLPPFTAINDGEVEDTEDITIAYTFVNACGTESTIQETLFILDYEEPVLTADPVESPCPGTEVTLTASSEGYAPFTYVWSTSDEGASIQVSPENDETYTVEATDVCGTTVSTDVDVTVLQDPPPVILIPQDDVEVTCPGDNVPLLVVVESGSPGYTYTWSTNQNGTQINVSPEESTTYVVTVEDACFQTAVDSIDVIVPVAPELEADISIDELPTCPGDQFQLTANVDGGTPQYTYSWAPDFGFNQTLSPNPPPTTNTTYSVTITDICGVQTVAEFDLEMPVSDPPISVSAEALNESTCPGEDVELSASVSGGFGSELIYFWDGDLVEDLNITVNPTTTTTYTFTAEDECGVQESVDVQVEVEENPIVIETETIEVSCTGFEVEVSAAASGGFGSLEYLWENGDEDSLTTVIPSESGINEFTLTVTDECGQVETAAAVVEVNQIPIEIETQGAEAECIGLEVEIYAIATGGFGNLEYAWSSGGIGDTTIVAPDNINGNTYTVTVSDECGVEVSEEVDVTVTQFDPIEFEVDVDGRARCPGNSISVEIDDPEGGNEPLAFVWENGAEGEIAEFEAQSSDEVFSVTATDQCGVTETVEFSIEVEEYDDLQLVFEVDSCVGGIGEISEIIGGAQFDDIDYTTIEISPGGAPVNEDGSFISSVNPGDYSLIVTDNCGVISVFEFEIVTCPTIIPNIFTPNGDGDNDAFTIESIENYRGSNLRIWNRWGNLVYESDDYDNEDPFTGEGLSEGTYFYELGRSDGETFSGPITIAR